MQRVIASGIARPVLGTESDGCESLVVGVNECVRGSLAEEPVANDESVDAAECLRSLRDSVLTSRRAGEIAPLAYTNG